jgi:ABC-type glutathione transport system ATPase component
MLEVRDLVKEYSSGGFLLPRASTMALMGVNLNVAKGECVGIVGESGSGKTTLARCILQLEKATSGTIHFEGNDLSNYSRAEMRRVRSRLQAVFQDPYASLDPRMSVDEIIGEPMVIHREIQKMTPQQRRDRTVELLELVRMGPEHLRRFPHEFSGGQRQRIGIARALACNPSLVVLDEPTSALDVSVQADVLDLLDELRTTMGLTYVFISHDLAVVRLISDRVMLLYKGEVVEEGVTNEVFDSPTSDYAKILLAALPEPDPRKSPYRYPQTVAEK